MTLAGRTFRKRPGRTAMLTAAVAVSVALLVALQSLAAGFLAAQTSSIRDRAVDVVMQPLATRGSVEESGLSAAGIEGIHVVARDVRNVSGISGASPTLEAILTARDRDGNVSAVLAQGVIPADHLATLGPADRAKFHGWFTNAQDGDESEVVVNEALASHDGLVVGSVLQLAASSNDAPRGYRVVGVFSSPFTGGGLFGGTQIAILKLTALQGLTGLVATDAGTRVSLRLDDATREDPTATARVLDTLGARYSGYQFLTKADELAAARERAAVSAGFYTAVANVSLVVSALFIASVMMMEVQQRRRDLGVLRAIGWSRASVFRSVAAEALAFVALGTAVGIALGYVGSDLLGRYFQAGYGLDVSFTSFTWELAVLSAVQALVVGVAAALYPAWSASRVDALRVIRSAR